MNQARHSYQEYQRSINHSEKLLEFINTFHGGRACEIRLLPENKSRLSHSFIMDGESVYVDTKHAKKHRYASITPETFENLLMQFYLDGGGAPCFTVNSINVEDMDNCRAKNEDVVHVNAQFVDVDAPKDIRHDERAMMAWKKTVARKVLDFILSPSVVVESKHGYHVYWLLDDGQVSQYRHIQMQLVQHFGGDENCINIARVMRLPGFMHNKDPRHPFPVKVKWWHPERRYMQEDLIKALPQLQEATAKRVLQVHSRTSDDRDTPNVYEGDRKQRIMDSLVRKFDIESSTSDKLVVHCCLPDHADNHASAWVDTEYMWFHCAGCGTSYAIDNLAEELGWQDVVDEINRYHVDLDGELARIKQTLVSATDVPELTLTATEQAMVADITDNVVAQLDGYGQKVSNEHRQYIEDIVVVLLKGKQDGRTFVAPLDMGAGKSTIIQVFIAEILNYIQSFGAVIAVSRANDAQMLAEAINNAIGEPSSIAIYGFDEDECLANTELRAGLKYCVERTASRKNCPFKGSCRYFQQFKIHGDYPVLIMTHKRLADDLVSLGDKYGTYTDSTGTKRRRTLLIVDEQPLINSVVALEQGSFDSDEQFITRLLSKLDNPLLLKEWTKAAKHVRKLFACGEGREQVKPLSNTFTFSPEFWKTVHGRLNYTQSAYSLPEMVESVLTNGGHKETTQTGVVRIFTAQYTDYSRINGFNTVILDGTADIDPDYVHSNFRTLDFEPLRSYEGLTIYACNSVSGSKTSMGDMEKIKALCDDIRVIAHENPLESIFLPVFKDNERHFEEFLHDLIDEGRILLAHYGETRGSNRFKDCSIVVIGGILHKGESHYIEKTKAIYKHRNKDQEDIAAKKIGKVRRFNDPTIELVKVQDMLVDYSQEIKRTSQRDNTRNVEGKVYIFHTDDLLLKNLGRRFPGCKTEEWIPLNIIESRVKRKSNNGNQQAVLTFIKEQLKAGVTEIWYKEIKEATGLTHNPFNKVIKSTTMQQLLLGLNLKEDTKGKQKKLVRVQ